MEGLKVLPGAIIKGYFDRGEHIVPGCQRVTGFNYYVVSGTGATMSIRWGSGFMGPDRMTRFAYGPMDRSIEGGGSSSGPMPTLYIRPLYIHQ
jgi:hypothetical protein